MSNPNPDPPSLAKGGNVGTPVKFANRKPATRMIITLSGLPIATGGAFALYFGVQDLLNHHPLPGLAILIPATIACIWWNRTMWGVR